MMWGLGQGWRNLRNWFVLNRISAQTPHAQMIFQEVWDSNARITGLRADVTVC
jgi:hypothetical protein